MELEVEKEKLLRQYQAEAKDQRLRQLGELEKIYRQYQNDSDQAKRAPESVIRSIEKKFDEIEVSLRKQHHEQDRMLLQEYKMNVEHAEQRHLAEEKKQSELAQDLQKGNQEEQHKQDVESQRRAFLEEIKMARQQNQQENDNDISR